MPISAGSVRDLPVRGIDPCGLTWLGECLWFSEAVSGQISAVDPVTGKVVHRVDCAGVRGDLTTYGGLLVQVVGDRMALRFIDPESGRCEHELANPCPGSTLRGLEATSQGIWFGYSDLRRAELRDPEGLRLLDTIHLRRQVSGLTASDSYVAYSHRQSGLINLVDVQQGREVASYDVAGNPTGVTWDGTRIWYCDWGTLQIRAIEVLGISQR